MLWDLEKGLKSQYPLIVYGQCSKSFFVEFQSVEQAKFLRFEERL